MSTATSIRPNPKDVFNTNVYESAMAIMALAYPCRYCEARPAEPCREVHPQTWMTNVGPLFGDNYVPPEFHSGRGYYQSDFDR